MINFLNHGTAVRGGGDHSLLSEPDEFISGEDTCPIDLDYETPLHHWRPIPTGQQQDWASWEFRPQCFVDGKEVGQTVAWLTAPIGGYPVPLRLSEIGAIALREQGQQIRREHHEIERVVCLLVDLFPWHEVERFASSLRVDGYRLLPVRRPVGGWSYMNEPMRLTTEYRAVDEMKRLEAMVLTTIAGIGLPTLVDGRLEPHRSALAAFDLRSIPVVGLIKTHSRDYLEHPEAWSIFYSLQPGERTPAFLLSEHDAPLVSCYLRLGRSTDQAPSWGVVRLAIPHAFLESITPHEFDYLDRLSRLICAYGCREQAYPRAPISIYPIQWAEEKLGALFSKRQAASDRF